MLLTLYRLVFKCTTLLLCSCWFLLSFPLPLPLQPDLEQSMAELAYLGSLLGMPNILDPTFPLAYTAFFAPLTSGGAGPGKEAEGERVGLGGGAIKVEPPEDSAHVHTSNVSWLNSVAVCSEVWDQHIRLHMKVALVQNTCTIVSHCWEAILTTLLLICIYDRVWNYSPTSIVRTPFGHGEKSRVRISQTFGYRWPHPSHTHEFDHAYKNLYTTDLSRISISSLVDRTLTFRFFYFLEC
jgi:hypothetical protein